MDEDKIEFMQVDKDPTLSSASTVDREVVSKLNPLHYIFITICIGIAACIWAATAYAFATA